MKYINLHVFALSLILGLILNYVMKPNGVSIKIFPTSSNHKHIQYKDKADNCFGFIQHEVLCPRERENISMIPFQR